MDRESLITVLVEEFGHLESDARQAVGNAEDYIADMLESGADGYSIALGIEQGVDFWRFMEVEDG